MRIVRLALVAAAGLMFAAMPAPGQPIKDKTPTKEKTPTPATTKASGKIDLRPHFKVGQETRLKMETDVSRKEGDAKADSTSQSMSGTLLLRCTQTDPETGSTLDAVFETFKFTMKGPAGNIDFDSTKPGGPGEDLLGDILKTPLTVKMDPDGNITSVSGGAMGALGEGMSAGDLLKGLFGPIATAKKGTGQVNVGDRWTNEDTMDAGLGTVRITTTNTLKSYVSPMATIGLTGTFSLDPSSASKGVSIRDSSLAGEVKWDTEAGMIDSMNVKQKCSVEQRQDKGPPKHETDEITTKVTRVKK
jgi:hypothetical protein